MTVPVMLMRMLAAAKSRAMKQGRELAEESMTAVTRKRLEAKQRKTIDEIKDLRRQIKEQTPPDQFPPEGFSQGGRVIGPGLSGLLRNYTQGPLARVSRETQEPVGMRRGGGMGILPGEMDFRRFPPSFPGNVAPPPLPPVVETAPQSPIQQPSPVTSPRSRTALPGDFVREGRGPDADVLQLPSTPVTTLARETFAPPRMAAGSPINVEGVLPTTQSSIVPQQAVPPVAAQQEAERKAAEQAAAEEAARVAAQQEAARIAAEEAARVAAEQLAAEQLAAEQLAAEQLAAEQLAAEQLAAQEAAAQQAAQEAAARQTSAAPTTMAATEAAAPAMPTTQDLIAEQRALEQAALMGNLVSAPGQTANEPGMFLREGSDVLVSPVITDYQGRGGTRPVETTPVDTTPVDTTPVDDSIGDSGDAPADPVATDPVDTTPVATDPVATDPVDTTPVQTTPVATTPVATTPVQTVPTDPVYLPPVETTPVVEGPSAAEVLAAEQAAADALAAQEAEQLRIAQEEADRVAAEQEAIRIANEQAAAELLAQQEAARIAQEQAAAEEAQRLAAETLAAQQAAEEAERIRLAEEEAQRIAAEQAAADAAAAQALADEQAALEALAVRQAAEEAAALAAEQEALAAAEAERIAAAQLAAEQLAAQQAAQLAAEQEAAAQLQAAEQLAAQQEADRIAMEAQLAATPDPDPIYDAPTQGELLQAAETAQAATEDLFTTPTDTGTAIDRGAYGQVLEPVTTTTQQDPAQQNVTPAVITEASDGTLHPTPAAAAAYEAELAARQQQAGLGIGGLQTLLNRVDLDVSDVISDYTTGYPTSQGMEIQRTYMPFEGTEEERATGYTMPIYKPVANQTMPSLFRTREVTADSDAFQAGSDAPGPDSGTINTGSQSTPPGSFGLEQNEMYQCPNRYVLSFVNGNPVCNLVGGGGPGMKRQVPPKVVDITGGMRYGGEVGLNRGIGSFGA